MGNGGGVVLPNKFLKRQLPFGQFQGTKFSQAIDVGEGTAVVDENVGRGFGNLQIKFDRLRFDGRMAVDDDPAVEPSPVDIGAPIAQPKHSVLVAKRVGDVEVEPRVDE